MRKTVIALLLACYLTIPAAAVTQPAIRVAFLDTGIATKYIAEGQIAVGKNYIFPNNDTQDQVGHGTATAGMMLGSQTLGMTGSCPEAVAVPLVCYDLYPSGVSKNGGLDVLCAAIYDAVDVYHCRVINMSLGVAAQSDDLLKAVTYAEEKGVVVVSAVGNDNLTAPDRNYYPACYPTVIGVGAAEGQKTAKFSQRNGVSLLAPGVNLPAVTHRNAPESVTRSGSSYACATVSGLCAAILTQQPELTPAQVRERLFIEAADIEQAGFDTDSGWGLVGQKQNAPIRRDALLSSLYRYDCYTHAQTPEEGTAAFNWAIQQAISDGSKLEDNITREQLATILYRYEKATPVQLNLNAFTDQNTISDFAKNAMAWAVQTGILMGNNGKLNPQGNATRAELTNFIHP